MNAAFYLYLDAQIAAAWLRSYQLSPILSAFCSRSFFGHFLVAHTSNIRPLTEAPLRETFS